MSKFQTIRGMRDFLPREAATMKYVEQVTRELAHLYCYEEVITPIVESYDLLTAKSGEEIRKRMYAFSDLGGRKVGLRPEFTASIARLIATKMMNAPKPIRLYCCGRLYRYDEPQALRYREFWQSNYELIGSDKPEADAEILILTHNLMTRLRLRSWFKIGHVGILRGILSQEDIAEEQQNQIMQLLDNKRWDEALAVAQEAGGSQIATTTLKDILETRGKNVVTVLKKAKHIVSNYDDAMAAVENLQTILDLVKESGAKFEILIEAGFARGLEYYTGMVFQPYVPELEREVGGGGRYDKLIELFGGESTPAVGVAHGLGRLDLAMKKQKVLTKIGAERRVIVIPIGDEMRAKALELSLTLRHVNIPAEVEVMGRTVSKALSDANRRNVTHAVILGAEELKMGKVVLRGMKERVQETVTIENLSDEILKTTA
ncbi:MAG: histidine--tRNA ligase [Candidatus Bathyarchaeota archaeon]|nr:histidine--tRNA ligase [Candidatus Bathyarchaeota archaeon]MDH5733840.1 histidine--tRNA ligase [Candidatus Bathyarchaeota archaeon]